MLTQSLIQIIFSAAITRNAKSSIAAKVQEFPFYFFRGSPRLFNSRRDNTLKVFAWAKKVEKRELEFCLFKQETEILLLIGNFGVLSVLFANTKLFFFEQFQRSYCLGVGIPYFRKGKPGRSLIEKICL